MKMEKQTHTPGPWSASGPDTSYHDVVRVWADARDDKPVAICPQMDSPIIAVFKGETNATTEAALNARLIAAAPELLAALQACLAPDGGFYCTAEVERAARAAIARATAEHS